MTNEDRVTEFKSKLDNVFKAYFITELCANAVEIIVAVVVLINVLKTDNQRALMLTILVMFVVLFATSSITIKMFFGSFSGFNKIVTFRSRFDFASKKLADSKKDLEDGKITDADYRIEKMIYDDEINKLAEEINNIKTKK